MKPRPVTSNVADGEDVSSTRSRRSSTCVGANARRRASQRCLDSRVWIRPGRPPITVTTDLAHDLGRGVKSERSIVEKGFVDCISNLPSQVFVHQYKTSGRAICYAPGSKRGETAGIGIGQRSGRDRVTDGLTSVRRRYWIVRDKAQLSQCVVRIQAATAVGVAANRAVTATADL